MQEETARATYNFVLRGFSRWSLYGIRATNSFSWPLGILPVPLQVEQVTVAVSSTELQDTEASLLLILMYGGGLSCPRLSNMGSVSLFSERSRGRKRDRAFRMMSFNDRTTCL